MAALITAPRLMAIGGGALAELPGLLARLGLARPLIVTVSYHEAGRFLDVGEQVDAVPMPVALLKAMESFIAVHYRPEPRKKVKRNELYEGEDRRRGDPSGGHDR